MLLRSASIVVSSFTICNTRIPDILFSFHRSKPDRALCAILTFQVMIAVAWHCYFLRTTLAQKGMALKVTCVLLSGWHFFWLKLLIVATVLTYLLCVISIC